MSTGEVIVAVVGLLLGSGGLKLFQAWARKELEQTRIEQAASQERLREMREALVQVGKAREEAAGLRAEIHLLRGEVEALRDQNGKLMKECEDLRTQILLLRRDHAS